MNKFKKVSLLPVDVVIKDNDGVDQVFTFKMLPFEVYPRAYDLISKVAEEGAEDVNIEELLSKETMKELMELEKEMVLNSYDDLSNEEAEQFVSSNVLPLFEPLMQLTFGRTDGLSKEDIKKIKKQA